MPRIKEINKQLTELVLQAKTSRVFILLEIVSLSEKIAEVYE